MSQQELLSKMTKAIVDADKEEAVALAKEAIKKRLDLNDVIEKGYVPGIQNVGHLWEQGECFLPELITSAECMKAAMEVLQPKLRKAHIVIKYLGKVVIGTVEGDIHDIGKNLVSSILSANGFDIIDLGADVKLEKFIEKAEQEKADLICLSALLTTTMIGQKKLIEMLKERKLYGRFKVMVGGAPVNQNWADSIGADGYAANALTAVDAAKHLIKK